jgi:hypothetical protein
MLGEQKNVVEGHSTAMPGRFLFHIAIWFWPQCNICNCFGFLRLLIKVIEKKLITTHRANNLAVSFTITEIDRIGPVNRLVLYLLIITRVMVSLLIK